MPARVPTLLQYLAIALLLFGSLCTLAQSPVETIHVDVSMVSVDVGVFTPDGRPVMNLIRDDFQIYEDGERRDLQYFVPADAPYNLVLLFDCSESTKFHWPLFEGAAAQFLKYRRSEDRVLFAVFGETVQVVREWNSRTQADFSRNSVGCAGTQLYEAMRWSIQRLRTAGPRRGVVVLTDGADNSILQREDTIGGRRVQRIADPHLDREFQRAMRAVQESGIPFYVVAVGTDLNPSPKIKVESYSILTLSPQGGFESGSGAAELPEELEIADRQQLRLRLEQLADISGGHVVFPKKPEDIVPMYDTIGRELGASYSLGYAPPGASPDGKRRRIEVRLRPSGLQVRQSRTEYMFR